MDADAGIHVRVLVRNLARVPRIARFGVEIVQGDVTGREDMERASAGCDIVFHCAYGNSGSIEQRRQVNIEGTENVMASALKAGVKRVVYLSTRRVYGDVADGLLDESAPRSYSGNPYSDTKLDAEKIALEYCHKRGLPVAVLQPTSVYGPQAPVWTVNVLERLQTEKVVLVDGGTGICNAVYIDDVVSAMLLAATREQAIGEAFLVSGERPVTWKEFYAGYARMVEEAELVSMSSAELLQLYHTRQAAKKSNLLKEAVAILREEPTIRRRLLKTPQGSTLAKIGLAVMPNPVRDSLKHKMASAKAARQSQVKADAEKPLKPMTPASVQFYSAKTRVSIEKARRLLGYHPLFDLEAGLELTEQWARWACVIDDTRN
jgi:nucleoside-diphosphate-sugar epimerase